MKALLHAIILVLCLGQTAVASEPAEEAVVGLSQNRVSINANFDGSEILLFGAVRRQAPEPDGAPLEVIVTIKGPDQELLIRRKDQKAGIWMNADAASATRVPSFYWVATSAPFDAVLNEAENQKHRVSVDRAIGPVMVGRAQVNATAFRDALLRIRRNEGAFGLNEDVVEIDQGTLFRTRVALPANLTEGAYDVRIFLTRGGEVISLNETSIAVSKVGLERFLFNLAYDLPLIYGFLTLAVAIALGWLASSIFQYLRR